MNIIWAQFSLGVSLRSGLPTAPYGCPVRHMMMDGSNAGVNFPTGLIKCACPVHVFFFFAPVLTWFYHVSWVIGSQTASFNVRSEALWECTLRSNLSGQIWRWPDLFLSDLCGHTEAPSTHRHHVCEWNYYRDDLLESVGNCKSNECFSQLERCV